MCVCVSVCMYACELETGWPYWWLVFVCMYVCVCMCVCVYVCMCACGLETGWPHPWLVLCMCVYVRTYVCMYVCVCLCMYVCMWAWNRLTISMISFSACVCMYVYVSMYVCMYVCVYMCVCGLETGWPHWHIHITLGHSSVWIGQTTAKRNITFATLWEDFSQT